ncbi:MAG: hypothetical protein ACOXZT_00545 [Tissierellaceae bacterium]
MIKKNMYTGIILIILGILFLLYNLKFFNLAWLLFLSAIFLIVRYILKRGILYLIIGLCLFAFSSVSLIDSYIRFGINLKPFIYLLVAGCGLVYLFYRTRERNWLLLGSILIALGVDSLIGQLWLSFLPWGRFFLIALALYLCYILVYRVNGIVWPKYISYVMLVIGGILIFLNRDVFRFRDLRLDYLFPLILIIIGVRLIHLARER